MNFRSREHDISYCFDPNELLARSSSTSDDKCLHDGTIDENNNYNDDEQVKWLVKFITRNRTDDLYNDLLKFNQYLLEKTLDTVHKDYDKCIEFGRRVNKLDAKLATKLEHFNDLIARQPQCVSTRLSELNDLLSKRHLLFDKRKDIENKLIESETRELLDVNSKCFTKQHDDQLAIKVQAIMTAYFLPGLYQQNVTDDSLYSIYIKYISGALSDSLSSLPATEHSSISKCDIIEHCYDALRLLPDFDEIMQKVQDNVNLKEEGRRLVDILDNIKAIYTFLTGGGDDSKHLLAQINKYGKVKGMFEDIILPAMCKRVRNLLPINSYDDDNNQSSDRAYSSADSIYRSMCLVKNELILPLEHWLNTSLSHTFQQVLRDIGISHDVYYSIRTAEMQRELEKAIVLADDSDDIGHDLCSTAVKGQEGDDDKCIELTRIFIPCDQKCCLVHNTLMKLFEKCYTHDRDIVDIRSCLVRLSVRYHSWVVQKLDDDTQQDRLIGFCIIVCYVVSQCLSFICTGCNDAGACKSEMSRISSSFSVDDILQKRLNNMLKDRFVFPKLATLLCDASLFISVESLPTILIRKQQSNVRGSMVDQSRDGSNQECKVDPILSHSYINNAFVKLKKYWAHLPLDDNQRVQDYLVCGMCDNFKKVIQQTLTSLDQVESGLAKLRKSKYKKDSSNFNTCSTIRKQLTSDIMKFGENVNALYSFNQIAMSDKVRMSLQALHATLDTT